MSSHQPHTSAGAAAHDHHEHEHSALQTAAVALGALVAALATTLLIPVLPHLARDLDVTTGQVQWLLTATLLVAAVSVPVMGRFADMFGRRLMLLVALSALAIGSLIDALTSNFGVMLVGRAIAGVSSAAIPLGISLLASVLPAERRGSATALISAMLGIGGALGLPLAGLIGDHADYHLLYWIGFGGALISGGAIYALVKEPPFVRQHLIDWPGIGLLAVGLFTLILGISQGSSWGWGSTEIILLLVAAVISLTLLIRVVEPRAKNPLIDLASFERRPIVLTNLASVFFGFALFASFTGTASYVEAPVATGYGFGSTTLTAGLCLLPSGLLMLFLAPVAAKLMANWGPAKVLALGGALVTAGLLFRIIFTAELWQVIVGSSIIGAGTGVGYASLPSLINANTPSSELAAANGLNTLARSLGSTLASAAGAALLTAMTISLGAAEVPSLDAYRVLFGICAVAALISSLIGVAIARDGAATAAIAAAERAADAARAASEPTLNGHHADRAPEPTRA